MVGEEISDKRWRLIRFDEHTDDRGSLVVAEAGRDVPFEIERVFWIHSVPEYKERAGHAHEKCKQIIIAAAGSLRVGVAYGDNAEWYTLNRPRYGLLVLPGTFIQLADFSHGAVCLVIASEHYGTD